MNCKLGDIARMVMHLNAANHNKLCRVVERTTPDSLRYGNWDACEWSVELLESATVYYPHGSHQQQPAGTRAYCADKYLRPLYDGDKDDETLAWKKVPKPSVIAKIVERFTVWVP